MPRPKRTLRKAKVIAQKLRFLFNAPFYRKSIGNYYQFIDSDNLNSLFRLFSQNIRYSRFGRVFTGKKAFEDFYKNERDILGRHKISSVKVKGNKVSVVGTFKGVIQSSGKPIAVEFEDFFEFDLNGKIKRRKSTWPNKADSSFI